jgi:hypothetical protein
MKEDIKRLAQMICELETGGDIDFEEFSDILVKYNLDITDGYVIET